MLTSSILYPVFTDVCRDPARIRRVIESHILNPAEFNGPYPIPTVAYNDPRYYKQKPPRTDQEGGLWRGNIWLPEAWIIVKGLYKYGYEAEATDMAHRLTGMMSHQAQWSKSNPQFACVPAEFYDSRTGQAQNIRRFSWTSAVAMDFLLGNYQNERVLGTNPERDRAINGHLRESLISRAGKVFSASRRLNRFSRCCAWLRPTACPSTRVPEWSSVFGSGRQFCRLNHRFFRRSQAAGQ